MALKNSNRNSLSKSILEMKFMKRTKEKVEEQAYQKEGEEYFGRKGVPKRAGKFIIEASFAFCEELIDGRMSFQGENPEIERIMELEGMMKNIKKVDQANEMDISDAQMAKFWQTTHKINVRNIGVKSEREDSAADEPKRKRPKFLKPADDDI
ncbi:M-phase phosphoprotein 6 [Copidosoma floridanum]|uniref:M-phase phosphoprotein 6 n=1 Tax=Copidosoma floridanum TaxID=29053 RepID=UPI0006C96A60|nr:M-phase phosphoprotein 6 [Copidosoma floridanum]